MRDYRLGPFRKLVNVASKAMLRVGIAPFGVRLLTTVGRKTGLPRSTPVQTLKLNERYYLVAPYGRVPWVYNARAAGRVTLSRGRTQQSYSIREVDAIEAAPVLKRYVTRAPVVLPFFRAGPTSPIEDFVAEAEDHPVFELLPQ
jgi:deazaflavin-dependent oxidoreductase (nitroreductase family)